MTIAFTSHVFPRTTDALLKSAWGHVYNLCNMSQLASAKDKMRFDALFNDPPAFTAENVLEHFGPLLENPRHTILRGLAEVFTSLDPAFKSHEKMKIGVKGLPKRVILQRVTGYGSHGRRQLEDMIKALLTLMGSGSIYSYHRAEDLPENSVTYDDIQKMINGDETILKEHLGIWLKTYQNTNGHLYFSADMLNTVNLALAEYFGEVLPDGPEADASRKKATSTAVSKDLQFYATPTHIADRLVDQIYRLSEASVLEPSCGEGALLDALRDRGVMDVFGIEYDSDRANICKRKEYNVQRANFLETVPHRVFDAVVMNPPFYGRHYEKHIRHALTHLKTGGQQLVAVLPATARYDHMLLEDLNPRWTDLPCGSFAASGTNIETGICKIMK